MKIDYIILLTINPTIYINIMIYIYIIKIYNLKIIVKIL